MLFGITFTTHFDFFNFKICYDCKYIFMVCQSPWSFIQFDCGRVKFLDIVFISLNTLLIKNGPTVTMISQSECSQRAYSPNQ